MLKHVARARERERERERKGGRGGDARNKRKRARTTRNKDSQGGYDRRGKRHQRRGRERRGRRGASTHLPNAPTPSSLLPPRLPQCLSHSAPHLTPHLTRTSTPYFLHASRFMRRGGLTKGTEVSGGWHLVGELTSWSHSKSSKILCFGGFHSTPVPVFGVLEDKAASLADLRCPFGRYHIKKS